MSGQAALDKYRSIHKRKNKGDRLGRQVGASSWDVRLGRQVGTSGWGVKLGRQVGASGWGDSGS